LSEGCAPARAREASPGLRATGCSPRRGARFSGCGLPPGACSLPPVRVAIIGGGVMGCATALALTERGAEVVLLERAVPGAEASSAAAGILGAQVELHGPEDDPGPFVRARDGWAEWARALREASGIDVGWRRSGALRVARSEPEGEEVGREVAWQKEQGLRAELLDGPRAREVEPELAEGVVAAAHFPDDAQVDPPALLRALMAAIALQRRVTIRSGTTVESVRVERDRCVGVMLDDGELRADATVLAAGSWSSLVPGVPSTVPAVRPVRGQMVLLDERPPRVRTIVFGAGGYLVPRGDGRVLCGSTMERVGFRKEVTAGGVHSILASALACVPSLAAAQLAGSWSNFRPHAEKGALVGPSPLEGLFLATGHHRNGILLAKTTADTVADAILGR
jgi:glycine oxidase